MSSDVLREEIIKVLKTVKDPDLNRDIVSLGFVKNMEFEVY